MTTASSSASSSSCCSRRSTSATATTSAATRGRRCAGGCGGARTSRGCARSRGCRSGSCTTRGCMERLLARPVDQRHRDVPRPGLPRRAARRGASRCCAPTRSSASGSRAARPARRSSRSRSRCTRQGCSTARGSTRPTWTPTCSPGRAPARFALEQAAATTRATTSRPAATRGVLAPTTPCAGDQAVFDPELLRDVVFAQHNLATDRSFNEFHLVVCRNVLIYFGRDLQDRVLDAVRREPARAAACSPWAARRRCAGTAIEDRYEPLVEAERIYRRRS